jgi:hypothetical protein
MEGRGATMPEDPWTDQSRSVSDSSLLLALGHPFLYHRFLQK